MVSSLFYLSQNIFVFVTTLSYLWVLVIMKKIKSYLHKSIIMTIEKKMPEMVECKWKGQLMIDGEEVLCLPNGVEIARIVLIDTKQASFGLCDVIIEETPGAKNQYKGRRTLATAFSFNLALCLVNNVLSDGHESIFGDSIFRVSSGRIYCIETKWIKKLSRI